jgi:hypothetical protein
MQPAILHAAMRPNGRAGLRKPARCPFPAKIGSCSALAGFLAVGITVAGALAHGWRWWPPYLLLASAVALLLLLAPDSYTAFGLAEQ